MKIFHKDTFEQEVLKSETPVLVDFFATWCGPCKMQALILEKLESEYAGRVTIGKLDVDADTEIAIQYGVMSVPTLILFQDGKVANKVIGLQTEAELRELMNV